ncbi:MAG: sarcosine oxidase subunit delta [Sphingorhabdus sp.]|jgi:sarcosine oxidase subunit delta|uniref:sarcosine oxidase subunit delta n=1 Tax=Sphingorhabdus sp. TaxID=1902408 RepID=UPI0025F0D2FB|nr:sarcosine oxidase subunit delta [Sphingorhabdus sp.]MCO4091354.1 sarcosine oxidase subunit delta [Sphingorhabdus sp.]
MLNIECPHCGARPEHEFRCGGDAHVVRPPLSASGETWAEYLFGHDNPKGDQTERWCHSFGCGLWFNVIRDTVSHEIRAVYPITAQRPEQAA